MGQSAMEVDIHNDKFQNRTWHTSATEEAWPALLPAGNLTEEMTLEQGSEG